jgi:hypothetical protein
VRSDQRFTEPVALLSTQPDDLPLPRTASGLSFNLLALRARCVEEPMHLRPEGQDSPAPDYRTLRRFSTRKECAGAAPLVSRFQLAGTRCEVPVNMAPFTGARQ